MASIAFADRLLAEQVMACPACLGHLEISGGEACCMKCRKTVVVRENRLIFSEPPDDADTAHKSRSAENWTQWRKENYRFYERELAGTQDSARIVDLGAGPSQFLDLFDRFDMYIGVDFVPYETVSVVTDFTNAIPLRDACVDVVILSNVLEHMQNPQRILEECTRMLKPGGILLATTPFLMRVHQAPYDFNRYTIYQHTRLLEQAGLADTRVIPLGSPALPFDTLERQFFVLLIEARPFKNTIANTGFRIVSLVCKLLARGLTRMAWGIYSVLPPNERFTEGYGSYARKP